MMTTENGFFSTTTDSCPRDLVIPSTQNPGAITTLNELAAAARQYAGDAKSAATRRAYKTDWSMFSRWCESMKLTSLPATPETLATYVAHMVERGRKVATIGRALVSISQAHKMAGYPSPTATAIVRETLKGVRRTAGVRQSQKSPVLPEQVRAMLQMISDDLLGARDSALLLLGFSGGFRRSEIVALDMGDIQFTPDGLVVTLRRSKTDQEAAGRSIGIPFGSTPVSCPVRSLRRWLDTAGITTGPVFRAVGRWGHVGAGALDDRVVARMVQKYAAAVGLDPKRFGGHSLRAGLATAAARAGKSERAIMNQTGHRSVAMVRKYIREGSLFADNAAAGLL